MGRLRRLFDWRGRASRKEYWLAVGVFAASIVAGIVVGALVAALGPALPGMLLGVFVILIGVVPVSLTAFRRLRDRNRPPILCVLLIIGPQQLINWGIGIGGPVYVKALLILVGLAIAVWGFIELGLLRGTIGRNRYGDDPLQPTPAEVFS